ncbi:MAG: L-2-amino-thiazoline-4-carboxylic acid hydrolase [Candidatus Hodarchaeales archaeon]|jgi:hypothetical protein
MELTHIKKREIQAPIAKSLLEGFSEHFGKDQIIPVLNHIIEKDAKESGAKMVSLVGGNSMEDLAKVIRDIWAEDNAMEMDFLEETDSHLSFNVTKCRYAEAYKKNNMTELGVYLSCDRDKPFTKSFNPNFELIRNQTIMEGADFCDFRFVNKKK